MGGLSGMVECGASGYCSSGEDSTEQKRVRKDTFDTFWNFAWDPKEEMRDTLFFLSVSSCHSWCSELSLLF